MDPNCLILHPYDFNQIDKLTIIDDDIKNGKKYIVYKISTMS